MIRINENYLKLQSSYLFVEIADRVSTYQKENPDTEIIRLGIGDVTLPLPPACIQAFQKGVQEMASDSTFRGYGPEQGYGFLREKIALNDYQALGADIVVHSITKFISGASDVIAGAVCGSESFIGQLMDLHMGPLMLLGPTMDPHVAANVSLRIPHLPLRMVAHGERALQLSRRLDALGLNVRYPGLPQHPDHELFNELRSSEYGYGGVLTLDVGDAETANALMSHLQNEQRFGYLAVSLGYFDTLMSCSGSSTSSELSDDDKAAAGISPGLVRMAVGYTGTLEQRWGQLLAALEDTGIVKAGKAQART